MSLRQTARLFPFRGHVRTVDPAIEPVTAAELREHLAETATGLPENVADGFIAAAREHIEEVTGLAIINQTWRLVYDCWPATRDDWWGGVREGSISMLGGPSSDIAVMLPRYPLASVDAVSVFATNGDETVIDVAATFDVDVYQKPGRMALRLGKTWPIALRPTNGVQIDYIAGYGAGGDDVPQAIKSAIMMMASHMYSHRGDGCTAAEAYMASGAASLAGTYKAARL